MVNASAIGKGFAGIWGMLRPLLLTMATLAIASLVVLLAVRGLREWASPSAKGDEYMDDPDAPRPALKKWFVSVARNDPLRRPAAT